MKKRLFSILVAGLTLTSTPRPASAASGLTPNPNITIDGQTISVPATDPTTGKPVAATSAPTPSITPTTLTAPVSSQVQSSITSAINAPVGNLIQNASSSLTNFAAQQTSGITSTLSKIPLIGSQLNSAIGNQISAGIDSLTTVATKGFSDLIANSPLGALSSSIGGLLSSFGFGGANSNPNTASTQAAAQTAAINSTVASYQTGANQAAAVLAGQTNGDISSIQTGLANTTPAGNIGTTITNVQGQQAVADIALNNNPTSGSLNQLDGIASTSNQVVAQSANGVAGQADLQSRVSKSSLNAAGMQSQAAQTYDNSLDQLNAISQQLGQQGAINAESVRIAAEQRTLTAAQLAQSANDAKARIREAVERAEENQRTQDNIFNGQAMISGMVGLHSPTPAKSPTGTPSTPTTPAASTLITD